MGSSYIGLDKAMPLLENSLRKEAAFAARFKDPGFQTHAIRTLNAVKARKEASA